MLIKAESPKMFGDNQASIHIFKGQGSWRTRCLANRAAALRARIEAGLLFLGFVASAEQKADGLTKTFSVPMMGQVRRALGLLDLHLPPLPPPPVP